jgi:chaperone modulatory protein CbpM
MNDSLLTGHLVEEIEAMTLSELAAHCACDEQWIIELVEEGIIDPTGTMQTAWRFSGVCLLRARTAQRLQQDLNINIAGIALVIDLMDEVDALQAQLNAFAREAG